MRTRMMADCTSSALALTVVLALLVPAAVAADPPGKADIDQAVAALAAYKAGQNPAPVRRLGGMLQGMHGKASLQRHMEEKLVGLLAGDADHEAKLQACQVLARIGTEASIPALEKMLGEEKTTHLACWALEPNPSAEALAALRRGLPKTKGEAAVAICNTLGQRRDERAIPLLQKRISDPSEMVAEAALAAVGKIATPKAADVLAEARKRVGKALRGPANDAYLQCASRLAGAGERDRAVAMFEEVLADDVARRYHRGALVALMRQAGSKAIPHALAAIRGNNKMMQAAAIAHVPVLRGQDVVERLADELPKQPARVQTLLLSALADRGGADARRVVTDAVNAREPEARVAAIKALAHVGDASSVPLLVKTAGQGKTDEERQAALISLRRIQGDEANAAILEAMKAAPSPLRAELISVLHGRGTKSAVPALLDQAASEDEAVQQAAFKALGHLAGPGRLPVLVQRLTDLKGKKARPAAERAVVQVARKAEAPAAGRRPVLAAFEETDDVMAQTSLIRVLGNVGGAKALSVVARATEDEEEAIRDAAVRALGSWPDTSAVPTLIDLAKKTDNRTYQVVALRGAVRLLAKGAGGPSEQTLGTYKALMAMVARPEDAKLVLAGLAKVPHPEALRMAVDCLDEKAVRPEACAAAIAVAEQLMKVDGGKKYAKDVIGPLEKVAEAATGKLAGRAKGLLKHARSKAK